MVKNSSLLNSSNKTRLTTRRSGNVYRDYFPHSLANYLFLIIVIIIILTIKKKRVRILRSEKMDGRIYKYG